MKPGSFVLNPNASAYVPLSKRVSDDGLVSAIEVSMAYNHVTDDDLEMEMDIDMDIEYLIVTFSGLSQESITDVYLANCGDLDATIEMLNQLEIYSIEAEECLPETLDIGDILEPMPLTSKA